MSNQLLSGKKLQVTILLIVFPVSLLSLSFIDPPAKVSGHIPLYKMSRQTVDDIIKGLPLDKRVIFEFIIDGSYDKPADVAWYKASGMNDHAEGENPTLLEKLPQTSAITFLPNDTYVLANNYLFVKNFKTYVRSLPSPDFEYLLFTAAQKPGSKHVYFKIRAHYSEEEIRIKDIKTTDDPGYETQPSPPANTIGN